jgi:hypothetical protein
MIAGLSSVEEPSAGTSTKAGIKRSFSEEPSAGTSAKKQRFSLVE